MRIGLPAPYLIAFVSRFVTTCSMRRAIPAADDRLRERRRRCCEPVSAACSRKPARDVANQIDERHGLEVQHEPSRGQPRDVQQIVDQADETVGRRPAAASARASFSSPGVARNGGCWRPDGRRQTQLERGERRLELVRRDRDELVAGADRRAPLRQRRGQRQHADGGDGHVAVGHQQPLVRRARGEIASQRRRRGHRDHRHQQQSRRGATLLEAQAPPRSAAARSRTCRGPARSRAWSTAAGRPSC